MPAVPVAVDLDDGVLTAAEINAGIVALLKFLSRPPTAALRQGVAQNLSNSVSTAITFDSFDVDDDVDGVGGHSTSSNPSRFTARYPGRYQFSGGVSFASSAVGLRALEWCVNGVAQAASGVIATPITGASSRLVARTITVHMLAGDYVELNGFQSTGGVLATVASGTEQSTAQYRWTGIT